MASNDRSEKRTIKILTDLDPVVAKSLEGRQEDVSHLKKI